MVLLWCADVQRDSIERFIYESGIASTKVVEQGSTNMSTTKVDKGPRIGPQTKVHEQRSTNKGPRTKVHEAKVHKHSVGGKGTIRKIFSV